MKCSGKCGDPKCDYEGSEEKVRSHVAGKKGRALQKAKVAAPAPGSPFYRPLKDLPAGPTSGVAPGASAPPSPVPGPAAPASPPVPIFATARLWKGFADVLDELVLKEKGHPIAMSESEAKALDASFAAMGFSVTPPVKAVSVPYYLPFLVTAAGVFGPPLVLMLTDVVKSFGRDRRSKKEDAREKAKAAKVTPAPAASPIAAAPPVVVLAPLPPMRYHEPGGRE